MGYKYKIRNGVKVSNISEVVTNQLTRNSTPFQITPEGNFYIVNGNMIPQKDFEKKYPVVLLPFTSKGDNSDKTKNWLHDKKSY